MTTSALAIVQEVREKVDREADELAEQWFAEHRVAIKGLTDERQQEYEDIRALATEPQRGELQAAADADRGLRESSTRTARSPSRRWSTAT